MLRAVLAVVAAVAAAPALSATLFFDDFEANGAAANATPQGWALSRGAVDITGPGYFPDICYGLGRCVDMDGSSTGAGAISTAQGFMLLAGGAYTLSFDYTWNYFNQQIPNTMTFGVGGFEQTMTTSGVRGSVFLSRSFAFTGDGSTGAIFFDHQGADLGGIVIDNVRLEGPLTGGQVSAVPLPAAGWLAIAGLGALGAAARRRR